MLIQGSFMIIVAFMLFQVWWDSTNSAMPAIGFLAAAANFGYSALSADKFEFVPRVTYLYAAVLVIGALHLLFFKNKKDLVDVINEERAARKSKK
jgi:hypothetical protein